VHYARCRKITYHTQCCSTNNKWRLSRSVTTLKRRLSLHSIQTPIPSSYNDDGQALSGSQKQNLGASPLCAEALDRLDHTETVSSVSWTVVMRIHTEKLVMDKRNRYNVPNGIERWFRTWSSTDALSPKRHSTMRKEMNRTRDVVNSPMIFEEPQGNV
jgi:hypothetical protein